jgi:hypothetical protein
VTHVVLVPPRDSLLILRPVDSPDTLLDGYRYLFAHQQDGCGIRNRFRWASKLPTALFDRFHERISDSEGAMHARFADVNRQGTSWLT